MVPGLVRTQLAITVTLLVVCARAEAQSSEHSLEAAPPDAVTDLIPEGIDLLVQGDDLRITRVDARESVGILERRSSSALIVATESGSQELPLAAIRRVKRRGDSPWDGLLIGAGIGPALGAAKERPHEIAQTQPVRSLPEGVIVRSAELQAGCRNQAEARRVTPPN